LNSVEMKSDSPSGHRMGIRTTRASGAFFRKEASS
jgi:hypothetical protein